MERNGELIPQQEDLLSAEGISRPPTFAQRLREGAVNFLKDGRGIFIRTSTYVLGFSALYYGLRVNGVSGEYAVKVLFPVLFVGTGRRRIVSISPSSKKTAMVERYA